MPERSDLVAPGQVLLFAGHMVDAPGRATPRFPAARVAAASLAIERALVDLHAGPGDMAFSQGAAGGDLIFAEVCAARGVALQLLLPLTEASFVRHSLLPSSDGRQWLRRYRVLSARLAQPPRILPDDPRADPARANVFERCNQWLLETALACGAGRLCLVCLWDGQVGDASGGTAHMVEQVQRRAGRIVWIDSRRL